MADFLTGLTGFAGLTGQRPYYVRTTGRRDYGTVWFVCRRPVVPSSRCPIGRSPVAVLWRADYPINPAGCHPFINEGEVGNAHTPLTSPSLMKGWMPKADGVVEGSEWRPRHAHKSTARTRCATLFSAPSLRGVKRRNNPDGGRVSTRAAIGQGPISKGRRPMTTADISEETIMNEKLEIRNRSVL